MQLNLINGVTRMAPDGTGAGGSADNGGRQAGNAEEQLTDAFKSDAGAGNGGPAAEPEKGDKDAGKTQDGGLKLAAWTEQLPPEMRNNADTAAKLAKFNKVGDMAKAFLELEGKAASGGMPGKDASPEEAASFWEKAGRPKTADGYAFAGDKENEGSAFAQAAFSANLTAAQAEALFKNLNEFGAKKLEVFEREKNSRIKETAAALAAEFGSKYQQKMEFLKRGLAAAGPNVGNLIGQAGLAGNPEIVKAFIAFGEMTAESGASRGGAAGDPMKSIMEGGTFEYKE
jgi:hypothetical protein